MHIPTTLVTAVVAATTTVPAIQFINANTNISTITDGGEPIQWDVRVKGFLCALIPRLDICNEVFPVEPGISARDMLTPSITVTMGKED